MKLTVSNSGLTTVSKCQLAAALRYGYDLEGTEQRRVPALVGVAVHAALEAYLRQCYEKPDQPLDVEVALQTLAEQYEALELPDLLVDEPDHSPYHLRQTLDVVRTWCATADIGPGKLWHCTSTELDFRTPLCDHITYAGRIDAIFQHRPTNQLYVVDHKTSQFLDASTRRTWSNDSQLTGYVWAMRQQGWNIAGVLINMLRLSRAQEKPQAAFFTYERNPTQLEQWYHAACGQARLLRKIVRRVQHSERGETRLVDGNHGWAELLSQYPRTGTFTGACAWCEFSTFCTQDFSGSYDFLRPQLFFQPRERRG